MKYLETFYDEKYLDGGMEGMDKYGNTTDTGFSPHESIPTRRESIQHFKTKFMTHSPLTTQHRFHSIEKKEDLKKKSLKIIFSELRISFVSVNGSM